MVSIAGNADAGKADRKPNKELVVGKWHVEFVIDTKGAKKEDLETLKKLMSRMKMVIEFKADGTIFKTMKFGDSERTADGGKWQIEDESGKTIKMKLTEKRGPTQKEVSRTVEIVADGNDKFRIVKDVNFKARPGSPGLKELVFIRKK